MPKIVEGYQPGQDEQEEQQRIQRELGLMSGPVGLDSLSGIADVEAGGSLMQPGAGPMYQQWAQLEQMRRMMGAARGSGFAPQAGFDVGGNQAAVDVRAGVTPVPTTKGTPLAPVQRANIQAANKQRRAERDERIQKIKDQKLLEGLNRFDPETRKGKLERINANRAKRDLGPLGGPQPSTEIKTVADPSSLTVKDTASGDLVRGPEGRVFKMVEDYGELTPVEQRKDEAGRYRGPQTREEQSEQLKFQIDQMKLRKLQLEPPGNLTPQERMQDFQDELNTQDLQATVATAGNRLDEIEAKVRQTGMTEELQSEWAEVEQARFDAMNRLVEIMMQQFQREHERTQANRQIESAQRKDKVFGAGKPPAPTQQAAPQDQTGEQAIYIDGSDESYNKLAPGTVFIGPDGKKRRKP